MPPDLCQAIPIILANFSWYRTEMESLVAYRVADIRGRMTSQYCQVHFLPQQSMPRGLMTSLVIELSF